MKITEAGIELIKAFEGLELFSYRDQGGVWTIGYGSTRNVGPGMVITAEEAETRLMTDLERTEALLFTLVPYDLLTRNQASAVISFCFNVGFGELGVKSGFHSKKSGGMSTMLKCILHQDFDAAANEFARWDCIQGLPSEGLRRRRAAERALFLRTD